MTTRTKEQLISACTADHPDHRYLCEIRGQPCLWTAWCSICDSKGYNDKGQHNQPNADMRPEYVAAVREAAILVCQEQQRLSELSFGKRLRLAQRYSKDKK